MYYQNYEDYMRSILGYPIERENTYNSQYNTNLQLNSNDTFFENINNNLTEEEVADLYPEIYKILNPMVCKICDENRETLSKDLITRMTDEIYDNFEEKIGTTTVNVTVNADLRSEKSADNDINSKMFSKNTINSKNATQKNNRNTEATKNTTENIGKEGREDRIESRQRNFLLRDLIQILILQRLLRGRNHINPPHRPRPPISGPGRPPMPRVYQDYYKF